MLKKFQVIAVLIIVIGQISAVQSEALEKTNSVEIVGADAISVLNCGALMFSCMNILKKESFEKEESSHFFCDHLKSLQKNCCKNLATKTFLNKSFLSKKGLTADTVCRFSSQVEKLCKTSPQCAEKIFSALIRKKNRCLHKTPVEKWPKNLKNSLNSCCGDKNFSSIDIVFLESILGNKQSVAREIKTYCVQKGK